MQRRYRLNRNSSFQYIFRNGQKFYSDILILYVLKAATLKAGVSVSKKIGNSVVRNRTKRRIKEAFRALIPELRSGRNFIIVAKADIASASYADIFQALTRLLTKAGAFETKQPV